MDYFPNKTKLLIDGGNESKPYYAEWNALLVPQPPAAIQADHVVINRCFERMKEPHDFLSKLSNLTVPGAELYLFSMNHDEVCQYVGGGRDHIAKAFGPFYQGQSLWLQNWGADKLIELFAEFGWRYEGTFDNIPGFDVEYPHTRFKFRKAVGQAPWQYALDGIKIPEGRILDVGPGNFPWPKATHYLETYDRLKMGAYREDTLPKENVFWGDIQGHTEIPDKFFDFALCSHVFEHLENPEGAAKELTRIAKRGVVIVPSLYKEALTFWDEDDHKWECFPQENDGQLVMKWRNKNFLKRFKDQHMQSAMNRMFHGHDMSTTDLRKAKQWFRANEKYLDVIIQWEGTFEVNVLE